MSPALPLLPPAPAPAAAAARDTLHWKQAAEDVFVATVDDEFAGYIAESAAGHAAHGAHAQPIGVYRTRRDAQDALRAHTLGARAPRPSHTVPSPRTRRRSRSRARA